MNAFAKKDASPADAAASLPPRSFRHRLYSNAAWSIGGRLLSMVAVFGASVLLARNLSIGEFSAYVIASASVSLLAVPAAFGAPRVILRLIRENLAANQPALAAHNVRACLGLVIVSSAVVAIVFVVGAGTLSDAAKWQGVRDYGVLVGAWLALSAICIAASHALQGYDEFRLSALVGTRNGGILSSLSFAAAVSIAWMIGHLTLWAILAVQVLIYAVTAAFAVTMLRLTMLRHVRQGNNTTASDGSASAPSMLSLVSECWPLLIIQLTSMGIAQIDVLMVGWLTQEQEIAAYGTLARLCDFLGGAQVLAAAIIAPFIAELYAGNQLVKLEQMLRGMASLVAIPTLIIGFTFIVAPRFVLATTFGPQFVDAAPALQIAAVGSIIAGLTGQNSLTMIMIGKQRQLLWISSITSVLYLLLAPTLISNWGIVGATTATTLIFGIYNLLVTVMVKIEINVWTTASFSPAVYKYAWRQIMRGRRRELVDVDSRPVSSGATLSDA